ncbi:glycogen synthase [Aquimarina brevivitae]|uniref:Glycogen synthase n=1 Tax=Aquimarina brevivitae TaxID=323412 RepID=A0A4Q7P267_9FLAO|nr:glycogen/starch synthase [Aquimarina brevivitae]RZS93845.1 starch synthase [Aquimarina brevivitae]
MHIIHTSFECYPVAKVGGLADVVGALPKYQNRLGHQSHVIMPFYDTKFTRDNSFSIYFQGSYTVNAKEVAYTIKTLENTGLGFEIFFVDIPDLLFRPQVYSYPDDTDRFLAFQYAVLDWLINGQSQSYDLLHCHDHHTALLPFLMTSTEEFKALKTIPTVLTIHNAQYQGHFGFNEIAKFPAITDEAKGLLDWHGSINPLAAGIKCAWSVTTVSPNYMKELKKSANGLEDLLQKESKKCTGILNGIDTDFWDPQNDAMLIKNFSSRNLTAGRGKNKEWLCEHYDLDPERPLFAFIGRLVGEKGADLLPAIVEETLAITPEPVLFILGSGQTEVEQQLLKLKGRYPKRYNTYIGYDEELSHIIYGGADFLLMPSRVEPCGLNQMYALRYGCIPIVRRTGGLQDTVVDIGDNGFGICHDQALVWDVCYSIKRAVSLYEDQEQFKKIQKKIIKIDHSWDRSAEEYINLYQSLK